MDPISTIVLPIFKFVIHKVRGEIVSEIGNSIRKAMDGQALIEFRVDDDPLIYALVSQFKNEFKISSSTISQDSNSIVLAFPGKLDIPQIDFFKKRGVTPKE